MVDSLDVYNRTVCLDLYADDRILALASDNFSSLIERIENNSCSYAELDQISSFIAQQKEVSRNNCVIAIRLIGGVSFLARKAEIDPVQIEKMMRKRELLPLIDLLVTHFDFSSDWFESGRCFYTEEHIIRHRAKNLASIERFIRDFSTYTTAVTNAIQPQQRALLAVREGKPHPKSHWICRNIEEVLELPNGMLDLKPSRFDDALNAMYSVTNEN